MSSEQDIKRALLVLHLGLVRIRNLAGENRQISELADALEILPTEMLIEGSVPRLAMYLETYEQNFPHDNFKYSQILQGQAEQDLSKIRSD